MHFVWNFNQVSSVSKGPIDNKPAFIQILAWFADVYMGHMLMNSVTVSIFQIAFYLIHKWFSPIIHEELYEHGTHDVNRNIYLFS